MAANHPKKKARQLILIGLSVGILTYFGLYCFLYAIRDEQGNRFKGPTLPADLPYAFKENFEELTFQARDGGLLNSVLFKADSAKGVICFWKGNGGTVKEWASLAPQFLKLRYDVLVTDYRQNGKSQGEISLENFYSDAQLVYDALKMRYPENRIVIAGFSLGGRIAAHLATNNSPLVTILMDPASTTGDFSDRFFSALYAPFPPVIGFTFQTEEDIHRNHSPIVVIGTDENANSVAYQVRPLLRKQDRFYEIKGATHGTLLRHEDTQKILAVVLNGEM
jgi:alpha/beta superfamily hydrolase